MKGLITNIQRFSIHDGPGIRTTIFFQGCPLSCIWCQNPETITHDKCIIYNEKNCIGCNACADVCRENCFSINSGSRFKSENCNRCGDCIHVCKTGALKWSSTCYEIEDLLRIIEKDRIFYDRSNGGVTLSGGEPVFQFDFCYQLAGELKKEKYHVTIDTSGCVPWSRFEKLLPFVDLFLFDLKIIDENRHKRFTGKSNHIIMDNFRKLCAASKDIIVRVPVIAGYTNSKENINQIKKIVKTCSNHVEIEFIPLNKLYKEKYRMIGKTCNSALRIPA